MAHTDGRVTKPEPSLNGGAAAAAPPFRRCGDRRDPFFVWSLWYQLVT